MMNLTCVLDGCHIFVYGSRGVPVRQKLYISKDVVQYAIPSLMASDPLPLRKQIHTLSILEA